jgi:hypothetical protein
MTATKIESKKLGLKCYFCGAALHSDDAHFEIFDQEQPPFSSNRSNFVRFNEHGGREIYGTLAYPGGIDGAFKRVVRFAHTDCGPDVGYNFSFDRLGEDWDRHLREKLWHTEEISAALRVARNAMGVRGI